MAVSVSNIDLMERVRRLTNKIYREILCIRTHEMTREAYITIGGLDHIHACTFLLWTREYSIVLSWELLAWLSGKDGISCSFTNFITTSESSGPLYISTDIYHTQVTEYSLATILNYPK